AIPIHRQERFRIGFRIRLDELGNAEVEQLHHAIGTDQDVGWLDIPMHDQVGMRVTYRGQDIQEELQTAPDIQFVVIAVSIEGGSFNILQHQIRLTRLSDAGIEDARDVRVCQLCKHSPLTAEALLSAAAHESNVQQFDGDFAFEAAIAATCEPDAAH